ncbi:MAG: hypothetical protein Q8L88_00570 [Bacteroidota bacterium]|nr:hypothetical protein [Bacteroidota bacterium]
MLYISYDDVADIITLDQFLGLSNRCSGYIIPGTKAQTRIKRDRFFAEVHSDTFNGKVKEYAEKYDVDRRTIYNWLEEYNFIKRSNNSKNKKTTQGVRT